MTAGLVRYLLRSWNALSASSVHSKGPFFFISWKKGSARSPNLEMKRPSAVTRPVSFCISLRVFGGLPPGLLLHGAHIWAYVEVVFDDVPGDPCQLIGLPSKHFLVCTQELDQGPLLLRPQVGANGES